LKGSQIPIPAYNEFVSPLLMFLAKQQQPIRTKAVYAVVADMVGLTAEGKAELLPSKIQPVYVNRIGWAHDALKRSLLSSAPQRGHWLLTDKGRELAEKNPDGLTPQEYNRIANASRHTPLKLITGEVEVEAETGQPLEAQSPEEQIETGLKALKESVAQDLLEMIWNSTPEFFERLVLDLLYAMDYGESRAALQHTGKSGDGGIDGIISLDKLGLQKVYVQAKKWKGQVGSPEVQGFMGALQLRGAERGVLITSGSISGPAYDAASQAKGAVVLLLSVLWIPVSRRRNSLAAISRLGSSKVRNAASA
jgi:restriction system protein